MYYVEKIIDGVLCCKSTPNGEWEPVSIKTATKKIIALEERIKELETELEMCMQGDR